MAKKIPQELYKKMLEHIPMCCVDLIVRHAGKVLMLFRQMEPVKNTWFYPGGRVFKGERLEEAAIRKAREELGLDVRIIKKVGFYEIFFDTAPYGVTTGVHTLNHVFLVEPANGRVDISIDRDHSDFRWIDRIEEKLHPYLKQSLRDAGVFG